MIFLVRNFGKDKYNYRKLNIVTRKYSYPLPRIDNPLDWLVFHTIKCGYWQVQMEPKHKEKIAISAGKGLYEFNVMPFGLCGSPGTFEGLMTMY